MGLLHRIWCSQTANRALTDAMVVMQKEFAKVVVERDAAQARVHVMETRLKEKLKHDDNFPCQLCYLLGDK